MPEGSDKVKLVPSIASALELAKSALDDLAASERKHAAILENAADAIIVIDSSGIIQSANPASTRLFEYSTDELIGQNVSMLLPEPHRSEHDEYVKRYLETGVARVIGMGRDLEGVRKDGQTIPMHLSIGDFEAGGERYFVGILHDFSMNRAFETSTQKFSSILEACNDAIISINMDGTIESWNHGAEQMYGYSTVNAMGRNYRILLPEENAHVLDEIFKSARDGNSTFFKSSKRLTQIGSEVYVSEYATPIVNQEGKPTAIAIVARDQTAERQAEIALEHYLLKLEFVTKELEQKNAEIEAQKTDLEKTNEELRSAIRRTRLADQAKADFLTNMSHEIRTPMTAILGFLELIRKKEVDHLSGEATTAFNAIHRNGEQLMEIINTILDVAKASAEGYPIDRSECSLVDMLLALRTMMESHLAGRPVEFEIDLATPIPTHATMDGPRLQQVLSKLLGNAQKFTHDGKITLRINFGGTADCSILAMEVIDTGIGITEEQAEAIFQPFHQADTSISRQYGGVGMGLTYCKQIVESHGGSIDARPNEDRGSTFEFFIPVSMSENAPLVTELSATEKDPEPPPAPRTSLEGYKILLAEDGVDNQRLLSMFIKKSGGEIHVVENGQAAIDYLVRDGHAEEIDTVLMDMQMPVMDGYTATSTLRESGFHKPVIAVTAHALKGDREKCIRAGCDDYMMKPVRRDELTSKILEWIEKMQHANAAMA